MAEGGTRAAGIGGGENGSATITIAGGEVTAEGGQFAAGIGGGRYGTNATVTISGGTVTATSGSQRGAGIGGGENGSARITISGGEVTATGGEYAAAIGGGMNGTNGTITITGGTITAEADRFGAGIGSGRNGYQWDITISNATVTATGGQRGAGIGGGLDANYHNIGICSGTVTATGPGIGCGDQGGSPDPADSIVIEGGIIRATGGDHAADIGNSYDGRCRDIHVSGGTIYRTGDSPVRIGGAPYRRGSPVTFIGGAIYAALDTVTNRPCNSTPTNVFPAELDIGLPTNKVTWLSIKSVAINSGSSSTVSYGIKDTYTDENGKLVIWLPASGTRVYQITVTMEDGVDRYFCISIDDSGEVHTVDHLVVDGTFVMEGRDQSGNGWRYYNTDKLLALTAGNRNVQGVSTNGAHRIAIPAGGASRVTLEALTLAAQGTKYWSAMAVSNDCTITVAGGIRTNWIAARGQYAAGIEVASNAVVAFEGDGRLVAVGGKYAAGIGSRGGNPPCGKMEIRSGNLTGIGGEKAAGIGGGLSGNLQEGSIVVKGGIVTGYGGANAAGIGAGYKPNGTFQVPDGAFRVEAGSVAAPPRTR